MTLNSEGVAVTPYLIFYINENT